MFCKTNTRFYTQECKVGCFLYYLGKTPSEKWGSRNSVGIAIQLSDSEQEKLFVHNSMQVSPE